MVSMGLKYLTIRSIKLGLELLLGHVERQVGDPYGLVLRMESVCLGKSRIGDGNSAGMAGTLGIEPLRPIIIASASAWIVRTGRGSAVKLSTVPSSLLAVGIASDLDVSLDEVLDVGKAKVPPGVPTVMCGCVFLLPSISRGVVLGTEYPNVLVEAGRDCEVRIWRSRSLTCMDRR
jgi:hypothetical protein